MASATITTARLLLARGEARPGIGAPVNPNA